MDRRLFLQRLVGGALIACPLCRAAAASEGAPHWTYEGAEGPEHWGDLSPAYGTCSRGTQQSPIDLTRTIKSNIGKIKINYPKIPLKIKNNGHTIQVDTDDGSIEVDDNKYKLLQFHFHTPSEHLLNGKRFEMELHFVHADLDKNLAVLGVMMRMGAENKALAPIWAHLPTVPGDAQNAGVMIEPAKLLPVERGYFRYEGSLTTPPCSETVEWRVFQKEIEVSPAQVKKFADLFHDNARPIQPQNRRYILTGQS